MLERHKLSSFPHIPHFCQELITMDIPSTFANVIDDTIPSAAQIASHEKKKRRKRKADSSKTDTKKSSESPIKSQKSEPTTDRSSEITPNRPTTAKAPRKPKKVKPVVEEEEDSSDNEPLVPKKLAYTVDSEPRSTPMKKKRPVQPKGPLVPAIVQLVLSQLAEQRNQRLAKLTSQFTKAAEEATGPPTKTFVATLVKEAYKLAEEFTD